MKKTLLHVLVLLLIYGCATIPPEITKTHTKEQEIIESLKLSHLAMVDSYVDQKLLVFENFFFNEYGPVYKTNWIATFKEVTGRDYSEDVDFPKLYNDLVAEYQDQISPIEEIRYELKTSIVKEYDNVIELHETTGRWISSLKKLNDSQKQTIDSFLGTIKPGVSLDTIDDEIEKAKSTILDKLKDLI